MTERAAVVVAARDAITQGSQSFAAASKLFAPATRERAWLLYAWCRAADDLTDGQQLGHGGSAQDDPLAVQANLEALTAAALNTDAVVPLPFAALRQIEREVALPRRFIADHLAGFALDAGDWRPDSEEDLLRYCYYVAGSVGCMMAVVMGVSPQDDDTLDRACDLGLAFQLANIARDVVPDALAGRCYLPRQWLGAEGLVEAQLADPRHRPALARLAAQLIELARPYRASARIGAARLPFRSRLAVLAADGIYGAVGEQVFLLGERAWDERVGVSGAGKLALTGQAALRSFGTSAIASRDGLWTHPR